MKHTEIAAKAAENNAFEFESNWDSESPISYKNARTLKRYKELCNQRYEVDVKKFDCFFAFSNEQFAKGKASIRPLVEGGETCQSRRGMLWDKRRCRPPVQVL